ncbi:ArsR/SmtB family transcription factor [Streptomyces sp. NPDC057748]|uniref:ArsR/SmtB family transcription factor n=1 Tax=unclassified Streptomyces TaxID=2593676 RepID=UPI00369F758B
MNEKLLPSSLVDAQAAETYASWFKALADPTRVQLLHLLARAGRPMSVGEIVEHAPVGQSTVSHHLKVLAQVTFVLAEQHGVSTRYVINRRCATVFPAALRAILGEPTRPEEQHVSCADADD